MKGGGQEEVWVSNPTHAKPFFSYKQKALHLHDAVVARQLLKS